VDWDKGRALLHLLEVLGLQQQADVLPIYIGDDKTDEDAFKALSGPSCSGVGVLVSTKAKPTAAAFTVRDPDEVAAFLRMLVQYGTTCANGWWAHQDACNGWAPAHLRHSISAPAGLAHLAHGGSGRGSGSSQPTTPHSAAVAAAQEVQAAVAAAVLRPAAAAKQAHAAPAAAPGQPAAGVARSTSSRSHQQKADAALSPVPPAGGGGGTANGV
jgi:trehalose 6-phosphate phosphatase